MFYSTCAHIGNEKILFTKDEIEKIKTFDKPSLKLVGFKPIESLKPYHNIKNSYFICPDDEVSLSLFFLLVYLFNIIACNKLINCPARINN